MMGKGLELQLARCDGFVSAPTFCADPVVYCNVMEAYNSLWDVIEANSALLMEEMWSWTYSDGKFNYIQLGSLPPPPGQAYTEADIVQLWSLTFMAITRDEALKEVASSSCNA